MFRTVSKAPKEFYPSLGIKRPVKLKNDNVIQSYCQSIRNNQRNRLQQIRNQFITKVRRRGGKAVYTETAACFLIDMTDSELLGYHQLSYHDQSIFYGFDAWSETPIQSSSVAAPTQANSSDDIENIYTGLHKSVDKVVAQISTRTPPRLDQIREQNRRLIDKLTTIQSAITKITTTGGSVKGSRRRSLAPTPDREPGRSKRRCVSQCTGLGTVDTSMRDTLNVSLFLMAAHVHW